MMRDCANRTKLNIHIYGPETHVTAVVPLALGLAKLEDFPEFDDPVHQRKIPAASPSTGSRPSKRVKTNEDDGDSKPAALPLKPQVADHEADHKVENFTALTRCVVYGLQNRAVQG